MHLEWLDSQSQDAKTVLCGFEDATEATVMLTSIAGELQGEQRRLFYDDIDLARQNLSHEIKIEILAERLRFQVARHLRHRAARFGRRAIVDYDSPQIDHDPRNPVIEHRVEAQLVTIMADEIDTFFDQHTPEP